MCSSMVSCLVVAGAVFAAPARADEKLAGIACRSVHLAYDAPAGMAFLNEVTVETSAPGTYFCAAGFNGGYFGIQELANGKKLVIFSVWDPTAGDDPSKVDEAKRVRLVHRDPAVRVGRFGGEGTGGQSFFDYDWKVGQPYRFLVRCRLAGDRIEYAGFFFVPEEDAWRHLVTFSTPGDAKALSGFYAFVEDFLRNKVSATQARRATYGPTWVEVEGAWRPVTAARFTADANPATNIDAGPASGGRFFLATGGETKNAGTPLRGRMAAEGDAPAPPADLPALP